MQNGITQSSTILTYIARLNVVVKAIHFPGEWVDVIHGFVVCSPRKTVWYIDLVYACVKRTVNIQSKQRSSFSLRIGWFRFVSHGSFKSSINFMLRTMTFHRYMWIVLSIQVTFLAIISCNDVALSDFSSCRSKNCLDAGYNIKYLPAHTLPLGSHLPSLNRFFVPLSTSWSFVIFRESQSTWDSERPRPTI